MKGNLKSKISFRNVRNVFLPRKFRIFCMSGFLALLHNLDTTLNLLLADDFVPFEGSVDDKHSWAYLEKVGSSFQGRFLKSISDNYNTTK